MGEIIYAIVMIGGMIGAIVFIVIRTIRSMERGKKNVQERIGNIESEQFQITPQMKNSLSQFPVENAASLRSLDSKTLYAFLSCSAQMLEVFENRIAQITEVYGDYHDYLRVFLSQAEIDAGRELELTGGKTRQNIEEIKGRLESQYEQAMVVFDRDFMNVGSVLSAIPERYRMSIILNTMCGYITDGEVDSWEGCVKTFKEDAHRMQQNEHFNAVINRLDTMNDKLSKIQKNTASIAFFSGITAWNTR